MNKQRSDDGYGIDQKYTTIVYEFIGYSKLLNPLTLCGVTCIQICLHWQFDYIKTIQGTAFMTIVCADCSGQAF